MHCAKTPLRFYFDFISPYGYFASLRIEDIALRHGRTVDWSSMLLGISVLRVMGLKPLLDTPLKADYVRHDVLRYARAHDIVLGRPLDNAPMNPLPAGRAFHWARRHHPERAVALAKALLHACWIEGHDLSLPAALAQIDLPDGLAAAQLVTAAQSEEGAQLLRAAVEDSLAAGVFGSPTVIVDGEMFWGVDKFGELDQWLASGGW